MLNECVHKSPHKNETITLKGDGLKVDSSSTKVYAKRAYPIDRIRFVTPNHVIIIINYKISSNLSFNRYFYGIEFFLLNLTSFISDHEQL